MSDEFDETLLSYENNVDKYIARSLAVVEGNLLKWFQDILNVVPAGSHVFEVGSGGGRDAKFLQDHGLNVLCSDAVPGFVSFLQAQGFPTVTFNVLVDDFPGNQWDMVLADAVLVHFTVEQVDQVLMKTLRALKTGGVFAFSVKQGEGSEWSTEKIDAPRFFQYWKSSDIVYHTLKAGFSAVDVRVSENWSHIIAVK